MWSILYKRCFLSLLPFIYVSHLHYKYLLYHDMCIAFVLNKLKESWSIFYFENISSSSNDISSPCKSKAEGEVVGLEKKKKKNVTWDCHNNNTIDGLLVNKLFWHIREIFFFFW